MADKKLAVSGLNAVSDATKEAILKAANVPHGAAKVVRDSDGKVVEVIICLPESASAAAAAALAATPGVSNIEISEIPAGTNGIDGTEASITTLEASGYVKAIYNDDPVIVFNEDDTMTVSTSSSSSTIEWRGDGKSPSSPLSFEAEFKIKTINGVQDCYVIFANDKYTGFLSINGGPNLNNIITIGDFVGADSEFLFERDEEFHVYKLVCNSSGLLTAFRDNVERISAQLSEQEISENYVIFGMSAEINSEVALPVQLDYANWTKRP